MNQTIEQLPQGGEIEIPTQIGVGEPNVPVCVTKFRKGPHGLFEIVSERFVVMAEGREIHAASTAEEAVSIAEQLNGHIANSGKHNRFAQPTPTENDQKRRSVKPPRRR